MVSNQKEYFAFISYQREDEKWANQLLRKLEHYRLPSKIRKEDASLPKEIRPIFRDTQELASGVLAKEIEKALQESKFLIVICSPNSAKSPWVNKEIETFIELGREERIIPFIIDGSPYSDDETTECFPRALRSLKGDRDKELLAINISDINRDAAYIKVVARMFGLKFDTLWDRYEREQRRKRLTWIGAAVVLALIGFSVGAYFVSQNKIIKSQNVQLQDLVKNLEEENNTYSQLQGDLKQYVFAGQLRGNGSFVSSIDYHPYEPIIAFSDDWGVWLHYLNSNTEVLLPTDDTEDPVYDIFKLHFSTDGSELIAEGYGMYVWNVENCTLIGHYTQDDKSYINSQSFKQKYPNYEEIETEVEESDNSKETFRFEYKDSKIIICNKTDNRIICSTRLEIGKDSIITSLSNPICNERIFITDKRVALYDDAQKKFVLFFKGSYGWGSIGISKSGEYLRVNDNIYIRTMKTDTIQQLKYTVHPIREYPRLPKEKNYKYESTTKASLDIREETILYNCGNNVKEIEVVKVNSMGNLQEYLSDALFAGPNKIVAIVGQGKHRIYNAKTGTLIGTLGDFFAGVCLGNEGELAHIGISTAKYINNRLYVLSSGGVIRIYDTSKYRLERVVVLPIDKRDHGEPLDKYYLADDGSRIYYSFRNQTSYYICELPQ